MISNVEWTFAPETEKWGATVGRHELSIAWDDGDRGFYLGVVIPPAPNVEGATVRVYSAPLPLLAVLMLLPQEQHERAVALVTGALVAAQSLVVGHVQQVVEKSIQPWPEPAKASKAAGHASTVMAEVERLSLDAAAQHAWVATV